MGANMKTSELLIKAKEKISKKSNWAIHTNAISATGRHVVPTSRSAIAWCSIGAVQSILSIGSPNAAYRRAEGFLSCAMKQLIAQFNDTHTHYEVMRKWDEAIALAKAEEHDYQYSEINYQIDVMNNEGPQFLFV